MSSLHSFNSYIKNSHIFSLIIYGFSVLVSWYLNVNQGISFVILEVIATTNFTANFIISKPFFSLVIKLTQKFTLALKVSKTNILATMKQLMKFAISLFKVPKINILVTMRDYLKILGVSMRIPKVNILAASVIARFRKLNEFDSQKLNLIDGAMLSTLDYIIVP